MSNNWKAQRAKRKRDQERKIDHRKVIDTTIDKILADLEKIAKASVGPNGVLHAGEISDVINARASLWAVRGKYSRKMK